MVTLADINKTTERLEKSQEKVDALRVQQQQAEVLESAFRLDLDNTTAKRKLSSANAADLTSATGLDYASNLSGWGVTDANPARDGSINQTMDGEVSVTTAQRPMWDYLQSIEGTSRQADIYNQVFESLGDAGVLDQATVETLVQQGMLNAPDLAIVNKALEATTVSMGDIAAALSINGIEAEFVK